jgi:hypothetical protein
VHAENRPDHWGPYLVRVTHRAAGPASTGDAATPRGARQTLGYSPVTSG